MFTLFNPFLDQLGSSKRFPIGIALLLYRRCTLNTSFPSPSLSSTVSSATFCTLGSLVSWLLYLYSRTPDSTDIDPREPIYIALPYRRYVRDKFELHMLLYGMADCPTVSQSTTNKILKGNYRCRHEFKAENLQTKDRP